VVGVGDMPCPVAPAAAAVVYATGPLPLAIAPPNVGVSNVGTIGALPPEIAPPDVRETTADVVLPPEPVAPAAVSGVDEAGATPVADEPPCAETALEAGPAPPPIAPAIVSGVFDDGAVP
jgi:hypothetical protein